MKIEKTQIEGYLSESYLKYAGYVAQNRAIIDSRDGLKAGGRKILYAMFVNGHGSNKIKSKGTKVVGEIMSYSVHGAGPIYGNLVRFGQPYSLRYPLIDAQGNVGTMRGGDDYSADRYLEFSLDKKAEDILKNLKKNTIENWHDTYDGTQQFPAVLPAYFPNVLVNGNTGIGVGLASSIPQFNLREVCDALIKAVTNSDLSFPELYCAPDFATGGILVNEPEIKEALKEGKGKAVSLVAKMIYDMDTNEIVVKELPYQVFTQTIAKQLAEAIAENRLLGVESFFDGTEYDENPIKVNIRIKLTKHANVNKIISQLYKETSLKNHFGINILTYDINRTNIYYNYIIS